MSAGRREPQADEAAGTEFGSGGTEGATDKKIAGSAARREAIAHLWNVLQMSEPRLTRATLLRSRLQ